MQGVEPLSPASAAGLRAGDVIVAADGARLAAFEDLRATVMKSAGRTIPLEVWRDGETLSLSITPIERDADDGAGGFERRVMIGVAGASLYLPATETPAPWTAVGLGIERMVSVITQSLNGLKHILLGTIGADNLQGPLGIAQISGETASQGLASFLALIGVISTAIGLLNLFPDPGARRRPFRRLPDRGGPRTTAERAGDAVRHVDWSWLDPAADGICYLQRHHANGELKNRAANRPQGQKGKAPWGSGGACGGSA